MRATFTDSLETGVVTTWSAFANAGRILVGTLLGQWPQRAPPGEFGRLTKATGWGGCVHGRAEVAAMYAGVLLATSKWIGGRYVMFKYAVRTHRAHGPARASPSPPLPPTNASRTVGTACVAARAVTTTS